MSAGSGSQSSLKTESNAESLSSAPIVTSNWDKFCLLLWKNWIVQWQHKFMLVFEIIMPVIYTLILVVFRASLVPERVPVMEYSDIPVNNLDILMWVLEYKISKKKSVQKLLNEIKSEKWHWIKNLKKNFVIVIKITNGAN